MKLLVTGGLGFIGSNFVRYVLATHQDEVTNLDNLSTGSNPANLADLQGDKNYRFVRGDIRDKNVVAGLVKEVEAIVNIAAETHVDRSIADPAQFYENNVTGTLALLEAIRCFNPDCRLLQVSTDEVYGDIVKGSFKESDALRPSSPYSASKAASDLASLAHHRTFGVDVIVTRCTNNYGLYQFPEKLVPKTIVRAVLGLPIPIYGSGKNVRDWIYVLDHCQALDTVLRNGKSGEIYNISSGSELTNISIVSEILRIMGKPLDLITHVEDRPGHDSRYSLDSSKLRRELHWTTECSLDSALEKTVNWYMKNEDWWRPLATEEVLNPTPWKRK
ncbi:dTDP-glucose 4,6-dehydratase [Candidatus Bathyarchaeota archaeon]|nr:dTDP-glucose 4,6-dehydratase [Candidatus Bathyarchaeota archaeon]